MDASRLPTYFLLGILIYAFVLLGDLGTFILPYLAAGWLAPDFLLVALLMLLPLAPLAAAWRAGDRHKPWLQVAFLALLALDVLLNAGIFIPLALM